MVGSDIVELSAAQRGAGAMVPACPRYRRLFENSLRLASVSGDSSVRVVTQPIRMAQ